MTRYPTTITGTRITPERGSSRTRACRRCGIDFPYDPRWGHTHCQDCRYYKQHEEQEAA